MNSRPTNPAPSPAEPIRVLFVLGSMGIGGTERQVLEILRRLDRRRFAPHLYLVYRRGELLPDLPSDVPVAAYWDGRRETPWNFPGLILFSQSRHLRQTIRDWRINLVYDRASHAAITAYLGTPRNVPRVSVVVADPSRDFAQSHRTFVQLKRFLLRRSYLRANQVLAVSAGVRTSLVNEYGLPESRIAVCSNLFDFSRLQELSTAACPSPPPGKMIISCVGRLQREKGQQILLEAIEILVRKKQQPGFHLWLIGDGPDANFLRAWVEGHQLTEHVSFLGFQANPLPYVTKSDVFCLPSLFEGMPNALVEAMACGIPVIAANCPSGPDEILDHGHLGCLIPPADPAALAEALRQRWEAWSRRNREPSGETEDEWLIRAKNAQSHVQQAFSAERGMARLEQWLVESSEATSPPTPLR